jgi:D-amino-acid oxidase
MNVSPKSSDRICVVGAGIIGLTTAFLLAERGLDVTIVSRETVDSAPANQVPRSPYTSSGSGGLWWPFHIGPEEKIPSWGTATYTTLKEHAERNVGVSMAEGFLLNARMVPRSLPWFAKMTGMQIVSHADDPRVPAAYCSAMRFTSPVVHMEKYLAWIQNTLLEDMNVRLVTSMSEGTLGSASEQTDWTFKRVSQYARDVVGARIVVNCTGIGAREFSNDIAMTPGRGVLLVGQRTVSDKDASFFMTEVVPDAFVSDGTVLAYAIPRGDGRLTLGGTYEEGNFSLTPTDAEIAAIRERVSTIIPSVRHIEEHSRWAGLRPVRTGGVRLEVEKDDRFGITVVHNYGHGGGGLTTCWGCAEDVLELILIETRAF